MRSLEDKVYYIRQQHFNDIETARRAFNSQCKILKRLYDEYPQTVFVLGLSEHGKNARKINLNEGKKGRPKVGFEPKNSNTNIVFKTGIHIHIYIGGLGSSSLGKKFVDIQNKLYHRNRDKHIKHIEHNAFMLVKSKGDFFALNYISEQSTLLRYSNKESVIKYNNERLRFTFITKKKYANTANQLVS